MPYYQRSSFSRLELYASYGPKHTSLSLSDTSFCVYFKYNLKTTVCLQLCYTPNNSSTTEDACFMLQVAKQLQPTSFGPIETSLSCCLCTIKIDSKTLGTYDFSTHQTTTLLQERIFVQAHNKIWLMSFHPDESSTVAVSLQSAIILLNRIPTTSLYCVPYIG